MQQPEQTKNPADKGQEHDLARDLLRQVELYEKEFEQWEKDSKDILRRYRCEATENQNSITAARYNVFWSNVETLKPALYARTPKPQIERKFKDSDPVGREAADILERATSFVVREYDFDSVMKNVRDDYLRIGRGQAWVRYVPTMKPLENAGEPVLDEQGQPVEEVAYEEVRCDYVHWHDFIHGTGRTWEEVQWVGRRSYLTKKEVKQHFGEEIAREIKLTHLPKNLVDEGKKPDPASQQHMKAEVIEIWRKDERKVYWVSPGLRDKVLKVVDDPLRLKGFFPCPQPLYATLTTDSLIPLSDFSMYRYQANELDNVTQRILLLTHALRVCGVYDESCEGVSDLLSTRCENKLIPVKGWTTFAKGGGFEGSVAFFPLKEVIVTLQTLHERQAELKAEIYEITGISDIVRGLSNPNETATAQQIKGQFATLRISDRQRDLQRFARDLIALKAEIIAEHYSSTTLALISGAEFNSPQDQANFDAAVKLLKSDALRSFRIDIETDSMIATDEQGEKEARTEFVQAVSPFMQQSIPFMASAPAYASAINEMFLFLVRGFKAGRSLEGALEEAGKQHLEQMQQQAQQPPPPDPAQQKAEAEIQSMQAKQQLDAQSAQQKLQIEQAQAQARVQIEQYQAQAKAEIERLKAEHQMALEAEKNKSRTILEFLNAESKREMQAQQALMSPAV